MRRNLGRAAAAGALTILSLAFTAAPVGASGPPPAERRSLIRDLQSLLRGSPPETTPAARPAPAPPQAAPAQTATPAPSAAPATTTTPAPPPASAFPGNLQQGSSGPKVRELEVKLDNLRYFVGPIDESYDYETAQAVMAFQKVNRMERTGVVTDSVWRAVQAASGTPAPLVPGGAARRVEVDLDRQVLFLYQNGRLDKIINASTGNGEDYCENGVCGTAVTPVGDFAIYRAGWGWETGPLGSLYNPQYFLRGYAIHGSLSVPAHPASHGCVRIPMGAAEWFPGQVSNGTPVHIR